MPTLLLLHKHPKNRQHPSIGYQGISASFRKAQHLTSLPRASLKHRGGGKKTHDSSLANPLANPLMLLLNAKIVFSEPSWREGWAEAEEKAPVACLLPNLSPLLTAICSPLNTAAAASTINPCAENSYVAEVWDRQFPLPPPPAFGSIHSSCD